MAFKKPSDIEDGPVWKGESEKTETEEPDESSGKAGKLSNGELGGVDTVEFGKTSEKEGMEMGLSEAVELAGEMLSQPEAFDISSLSRVKELEQENEKLRETVEQQNEAIADLASAVESLAENQANLAGMSEPATTVLDGDAFGDIYRTKEYAGFSD